MDFVWIMLKYSYYDNLCRFNYVDEYEFWFRGNLGF